MKFIVEIPDDIVGWVNAEALNRQAIAKFMREELQDVGRRYGNLPELNREKIPGRDHEWRGFVFNDVKVTAEPVVKKSAAVRVKKTVDVVKLRR